MVTWVYKCLLTIVYLQTCKTCKKSVLNRTLFAIPELWVWPGGRIDLAYALKELPQPHVDFTLGLLNLNPEPSSVST